MGSFVQIGFTVETKWTDVISLTVAIAGVLLAYLTFFRWVNNKKKDDSYRVSKDYLKALSEIQEVLREIDFQYSHLCPAPGVLVEEVEVSFKRIEQVDSLSHQLYLSRINLTNARNELSFWDVKLSEVFSFEHEKFVKDLTNINVVMTGLNSQLFHFYKTDSNQYQKSVIRHRETFNEYLDSIIVFLNKRISLKFDNIFKFK